MTCLVCWRRFGKISCAFRVTFDLSAIGLYPRCYWIYRSIETFVETNPSSVEKYWHQGTLQQPLQEPRYISTYRIVPWVQSGCIRSKRTLLALVDISCLRYQLYAYGTSFGTGHADKLLFPHTLKQSPSMPAGLNQDQTDILTVPVHHAMFEIFSFSCYILFFGLGFASLHLVLEPDSLRALLKSYSPSRAICRRIYNLVCPGLG